MTVIRFADVTIDTDTREISRAGTSIDVQPQVFDVLVHLIVHRGRVVSKEELLDSVWKHRFVTESALTSRIKSARQAIGDSGREQHLIRTMHGHGYRFIAPVDEDPPDSDDANDPAAPIDRPRAIDPSAVRTVRLPIQPTPFVGREFELGVVTQLVADPATRLVTILGPGGMGKTRLAIAAAERSSTGFEDGVFFVPLAPVGAHDRVVEAVADAVGLRLDARTDQSSQLRAHLRGKRMLLVLDNVEHLLPIDAAADLLETAPGVRILATSRERLGLRAERVIELGGMGWSSTGGADDLEAGGAVELFVRSARGAKADIEFDDRALERVRHVCRLVGGMPLAIELAAGWSDVLSIDGIASEVERGLGFLETDLRDVPERHRSIRAVCDSSWARLTPEERDVFMKLSVFRGGFTHADAVAVADAGLPTLRRLVATSMVTAGGEDRFTTHELLRQYGEHALAEAGRTSDVRRLHSDHHLTRLADRVADLKGGRQLDAIAEIGADFDNVRAAWTDAVINRRTEMIEGAVESLWLFFATRGSAGAMVPMIDEALRALAPRDGDGAGSESGTTDGPVLRAARGIATAERGDLEAARRLLELAVEQLDADAAGTDDRPIRSRAALAHLWLGWVDFLLARNDDARTHAELGAAHYGAIDDRWGVARCQYLLGNNDTAIGRLTAAEHILQQCCSTADEIGDVRGAALARRNLSILAGWFGRYGAAKTLLDEVLATCESAGDRLGLAYALRELGKVQTAEGRADEAIATLRRSISITDDLENSWESAVTEDDLANALVELGDVDGARRSLQRCLDAATAHANRYYVARCTGDLGALAALVGDEVEAKRLLETAQTMWEEIGHEPYLTSVTTALARVAAREPSGRDRAADLYASSMVRAVRSGLAPFALEVVVGAAELGYPEDPEQRASGLRGVVAHPAATASVRGRAVALLEHLADGTVEADQPTSPDWQSVADPVLAALDPNTRHRSG